MTVLAHVGLGGGLTPIGVVALWGAASVPASLFVGWLLARSGTTSHAPVRRLHH